MPLIRNRSTVLTANWDVLAMHSEVADLFVVKPYVYWVDFLSSSIIGWLFFFIGIELENFSFTFWLCLLISAFALYRAISFIHELAHLRKKVLPGFHASWMLLIGMPLMLPTFLYEGIHSAHHQKNKYGTLLDGEYMPFATAPIGLIIGNFLSHIVLPIFFVFRFGVLGPLSFLFPKIRKWVMGNLSGFTIRFPFKREVSSRQQDQSVWYFEEIATIAFLWTILLFIFFGILPIKILWLYYLIVYLVATLNSIRTIGATHRYRSRGNEISFQLQYKDSVNINSSRIDSLLICPVGLRFHALHHLFPGLPYHNLEMAHRRLSIALPASSDFHQSNLCSVWQGWRDLRTRKNSEKHLRPKPFRRFVYLTLIIIAFGFSITVYKNHQPNSTNEITNINNPMVIDIVGNVNKVLGGTKQKIDLGMRIKIGDIIETENRSFIKILTPAKSLITINQNSKLIWSENSLDIIEGNLFAEVKKKDIPSVYHLTAPDNSHIAITGTTFEWSYQSKNKNAELKVKEGVVEFYRGAEKKVTLQNQSLSTNDFIFGAKNILASSVAPWLKSYASIKNEKDCFIDNFNDTKFDSFWLLTSTQKINQSSPKNGLKCSGKDQRVELSSQELVMNHKDTILVSF